MTSSKHSGVLIHEVIGSTFAERANFKKIDFIQAVNGQEVESKSDAFELIGKLTSSGRVDITVVREGQSVTLKL